MYKNIFTLYFLAIFTVSTAFGQTKLLLSATSTDFDLFSSAPTYVNSMVYAYNSELKSASVTTWNYALSTWSLMSRTTDYGYDVHGNLLTFTTQLYDIVLGWENNTRSASTYNNNDQTLTNTLETWSGSVWMQVNLQVWTYNAGDYLISTVSDYEQTNYTYNAQNKVSQVTTLDGNENQMQNRTESWVMNAWVNQARFNSTYDNQSDILTQAMSFWFNDNWQMLSFTRHRCGQFVATQQPLAVNFSVYPNTTTDF